MTKKNNELFIGLLFMTVALFIFGCALLFLFGRVNVLQDQVRIIEAERESYVRQGDLFYHQESNDEAMRNLDARITNFERIERFPSPDCRVLQGTMDSTGMITARLNNGEVVWGQTMTLETRRNGSDMYAMVCP